MNTKQLAVSTLLLAALVGAGSASAKSACADKSESACNAAAGCGWVRGYTRSDGREVAAYCRTRSGDRSAAAARRADSDG